MEDIFPVVFTVVVFVILFVGYFVFINVQDTNKKKREQNILKYAKQKKLNVRPYFSEPLKYKEVLNCFLGMHDPGFCNVIEKPLKDGVTLYIGELQWTRPSSLPTQTSKNNFDYSGVMGMDSSYGKFKQFTTMCVLQENGFNIPNFDLIKESLNSKALEFFKLNKTEDIDFDEDKAFSDAWWLSSNENLLIRDLFTQKVRNGFMKFVDKGYRISGHDNMIIVIASRIYEPQQYSLLEKDILSISAVLKNNTKFYKQESE